MVERRAPQVTDENELAALVALSGLPGLSPSRLWSLLEFSSPSLAWQRIRSASPLPGSPPSVSHETTAGWCQWAQRVDPAQVLQAHRAHGIQVMVFGRPGFPTRLVDDPDPPAVLFGKGPQRVQDRVAVAVVGTRRSTRYGHRIARELGAELASHGILVVSGLAHGIDAAAHAGAETTNDQACIGVVASGLDVVYPLGNRALWERVGANGRLLSEWPLGATARPWRFPARNRLVAALAAAVVVVESGSKGGSLYTVDEALRRGREVFAVPGSIHSPASKGTNRLIADGAQMLTDPSALAATLAPVVAQLTLDVSSPSDMGAPTSWLLELIGWEPITVDAIAAESGRPPLQVTLELERQIGAGTLARRGSLVERVR